MNQITSHDVAEKIKHEHDVLRDKLRQIHAVLAGREIAVDEIEILLHEFQSALAVHFANEEEAEGFFEIGDGTLATLSRPGRAIVHRTRRTLAEVRRIVPVRRGRQPVDGMVARLSSRCHEFSRQLMHHESEESQLLQQAYQDDLGGGGD